MELRHFRAGTVSGSLAIAWLLIGIHPAGAEQPSESTPATKERNHSQPVGANVPNLSQYSRILIHPVDLAYTASFSKDAAKQHKKIGSDDLERIQRYFVEALEKQLPSSYAIATEPAPDVLRIDPVLVDAVVDKSAWLAPARDAFKKRDPLLLVAVLRDSQTGAIAHRVLVDARPFGDIVLRQSPLTYWEDMRFLLRLLATRVRWVLESDPQSSAIASIAPAES